KGFKFKKLYGKDFYYPVDKNQLNEMLLRYPKFFYIQYIIYFSVFISIIFLGIAYSLDKFF
ncbi:hypothetical protein, partial [Acinetobacter bereziniae]|uniref:hypothetical protein n=2 Tax=Acinetobacter TaxID=469 RepID=UPI001115BECB